MLEKYIIKKLLNNSKIFLLEYCLENKIKTVNTYFIKKKMGLLLGYNIKYFPILMSQYITQEDLKTYLSQNLNINFVLVKINLVYIKNKLMLFRYIKNKFFIFQFINLLIKIPYFLYKIFNLK